METLTEGKTAVIFGATGLTGNELLKQLIENGNYSKIIAVVRREVDFKSNKVTNIILENFLNLFEIADKLKADLFFVCTGTTIKKAGSKEAFRKTDYEIPLRISECAQQIKIPGMVVISSIGADSSSSNFYLRTKGEMEAAISKAYNGNLKFIRPSLLLGKRDEFRAGEYFASFVMKALEWAMIGPLKKYRGVKASEVARQMEELSRMG